MPRYLHLIAFLLAVAIAAPPSVVWADEPQLSKEQKDQLVALIAAGKKAYDAGNFQLSLQRFQQAYDIYPHPDLVYRMALCYEHMGEDQQAVKAYRKFLKLDPNAPERPRIEKTIQSIEARIAKSEIRITTEPPGAVIFVDDEANGPAGYTPTALSVKPGNYKVIVKKTGFETVRELVTVAAGQSVQLRYQLTSTSKSPDVQAHRGSSNSGQVSVKFVTLASIGVAAAITSVIFFKLHADKQAEYDAVSKDHQSSTRSYADQLNTQRKIDLAVAVSSAAVSVGALIWAYATLMDDLHPSTTTALAAPPRWAPTVGWNGHGPTVGWQFHF